MPSTATLLILGHHGSLSCHGEGTKMMPFIIVFFKPWMVHRDKRGSLYESKLREGDILAETFRMNIERLLLIINRDHGIER